jgi:hypothetical protein
MTIIPRCLFPAAVLTLAASAWPARADSPARVDWQTSWEAAQAAARETGRPIFAVIRCER